MQCSAVCSQFLPRTLKCIFRLTVIEHLGLCPSRNLGDQVLHPYKTRGIFAFPYILILLFLDSRQKILTKL